MGERRPIAHRVERKRLPRDANRGRSLSAPRYCIGNRRVRRHRRGKGRLVKRTRRHTASTTASSNFGCRCPAPTSERQGYEGGISENGTRHTGEFCHHIRHHHPPAWAPH